MTLDLSVRGESRPREQRSTGAGVARALEVAPGIELREAANDAGSTTTSVVGYACVTNVNYKMQDFLGEYDENVRSGAFGKTLQEQADVRYLLNHDGIALARTKSGTLDLREILDPKKDPQKRGQTGLWTEAELDMESGLVRDLVSAMKRGDMDEMSFAFQVVKQEWSPDWTQRDIHEVRLFDVSLVTYPANPLTSAGLRGGAPVVASRDAGGYSAELARALATKDIMRVRKPEQ